MNRSGHILPNTDALSKFPQIRTRPRYCAVDPSVETRNCSERPLAARREAFSETGSEVLLRGRVLNRLQSLNTSWPALSQSLMQHSALREPGVHAACALQVLWPLAGQICGHTATSIPKLGYPTWTKSWWPSLGGPTCTTNAIQVLHENRSYAFKILKDGLLLLSGYFAAVL